jgi:hypothetical protein
MKPDTSISGLGEIKTFPQGESAEVSALVSILNHLLEEIDNLKAQVAILRGTCTPSSGQNAKITILETPLTGQKKKKVVLDSGEKSAQNTVVSDSGQNTASQKLVEPEAVDTKIVVLETKIANQEKKIAALEAEHNRDLERLALEAAYDRQRVTKLEQKVQPLQRDRGEILRALIVANGGKVLAKYARLKMHLDKATFSRLLNTISDHVARKVHQPDRRQKMLVLIG